MYWFIAFLTAVILAAVILAAIIVDPFSMDEREEMQYICIEKTKYTDYIVLNGRLYCKLGNGEYVFIQEV